MQYDAPTVEFNTTVVKIQIYKIDFCFSIIRCDDVSYVAYSSYSWLQLE